MICLAELTTREAARVAADPGAVVLLPLGAIEQHGPHLPLFVDLLGAETLAAEIAPYLKRAGYRLVLAPALPYGVSTLAVGWSGRVALTRDVSPPGRRGRALARPLGVPALRADELPGRSGSPRSDDGDPARADATARADGAVCGLRSGACRYQSDDQPTCPPGDEESA